MILVSLWVPLHFFIRFARMASPRALLSAGVKDVLFRVFV